MQLLSEALPDPAPDVRPEYPSAYRPAPHGVQVLAAPAVYFPTSQDLHKKEYCVPGSLLFPASQSLQSAADVLPLLLSHLPAAHRRHCCVSGASAYWPTGHSVQLDAEAPNSPAAHWPSTPGVRAVMASSAAAHRLRTKRASRYIYLQVDTLTSNGH